MKIRTITSFFDPCLPEADAALQKLADFSLAVTESLNEVGYEVQSTRLATTPFSAWASDKPKLERACELEEMSASYAFQYLSIGHATTDKLDAYVIIPEILAVSQNLFATGMLIDQNGDICLPAVRACADIIARSASITPDGFANLRFAALANVRAYSPFFPSAYQPTGAAPACAVGVECADVILDAFKNASSLKNARNNLLAMLEEDASRMQPIVDEAGKQFGVEFKGFDFSTAPFPQDWCSLAGAVEALGVEKIGWNGSLAAAAFLADTLDRGSWLRTGFNGLFLPVMEDSLLALRAAEGSLTVRDLLLYSSVCGVGLDTVPLPGDSTPEQIAALLLDVSALSARLNKPLTARLMPVPGKKAGDAIEFDFEFFAPSRVLDLPAKPLRGLLNGSESIEIRPRRI